MDANGSIKAFLEGRRSFDALIGELSSLMTSAQDGVAKIEEALRSAAMSSRLPADLVALIRASLGLLQTKPHDDLLDAPTVPFARRNGHDSNAHMPLPRVSQRVAAPSASAEPYREQVDQVVLAALTDDFRGMRRSNGEARTSSRPSINRQLDSALSDYKGARTRRDATRAARGDARPFELQSEPERKTSRAVGVGSVLNSRFVLDTEIGRGGMGVVYRAVDRRRLEASHNNPYVAVKLLNAEIMRNPDALRMLEAEARRSQELAHPNIVTVHDFDRDGHSLFIVMELLVGRPLDRIVKDAQATDESAGKKAGLSFAEAEPIVTGLCEGLKFAHRQGVVHCDLKPANVFVTDQGIVKLLDFGIAIANWSGGFDLASLNAYTTAYASPAMLRGEERKPKDDVYGLGCLVYFMLAGRHPFGGVSALEAQRRKLQAERPDGVPDGAWLALRTALACDEAKTFDDADAFHKAYLRQATGLDSVRKWFTFLRRRSRPSG